MRSFKNIAKVIRNKRAAGSLQQTSIGSDLGYKASGQFISNVERELCSVPIKRIKQFATALKMDPQEIVEAMVADYRESLQSEIIPESKE